MTEKMRRLLPSYRQLIPIALAISIMMGEGRPVFARAPEDPSASRLKLIFAERFRFEAWDNAVTLDDAADDATAYSRLRTTVGLSWRPLKGLEVLGKVTNEFRAYLAPKDRPFTWSEVFFDNLYVKGTLPGRLPLTITAGRQDINLGEGFVIADGTPLDGSRSYYFNAVRVEADLAKDRKLILLAHSQETRDRYLPVVHEGPQPIAEQPERALALYYSGTAGRAKLDAYAIRKTTRAMEAWPLAGRIDTLGARGQIGVLPRLSLTVEAALQTGRHGPDGRSAWGGLAHADGDLAGRLPLLKTLTVGGVFLSGDHPDTGRMEGWDPLFSRWPKWSEGYVYTLRSESRPAYWSNLTSLYASLTLDLGRGVEAILTAHSLGADEPAAGGPFPGGEGLRRGTLLKGRLNLTLSRSLTGHLLWEHFKPGDFYWAGASSYDWVRFELLFRY